MAYMNQERKREKAAAIKELLKTKYVDYKIKHSMGVYHHSTLVFTLFSSTIDFAKILGDREKRNHDRNFPYNEYNPSSYWTINEYHLEEYLDGKLLQLFKDIHKIMMEGNHNNSDTMTDYFDVGWYTSINIGRWDKPYILVK